MINASVYALLLAAGQSRRMGRPKQLLPYGESTILDAALDGILESTVDGLVIVANPEVERFLGGDLPERCHVAVNNDPDSEMLASVQLGLATIKDEFDPAPTDGIMVLLADQPQVTGGTITTCVETYRLPKSPPGILIATYQGHRDHPTIFSWKLIREVADWPPDRKLNELAQQHADAVRELRITTGPLPIDVNTPEDYDRLRQ
ncbi:MAG: nucleotidyltransferase family protein [Planctomycetota bacterium]